MRREGHIMEEIIEYHNMAEAFDTVLRGTKRKRSRQGRYLLEHREEVIAELTASLVDGSFQLGGYYERDIEEYGKKRRLQILSMKDRIAVFAVMNVVDHHLQRRYIRTTGASIKRRGTHDLMKCIRTDIQSDQEGTLYAYKFDIRRFYDNVRQDFVMWCFRRVFKDEKLLTILGGFVTMLPDGISFGLRSSQGAGNLLLSVFLDHYLKDKYGVRHYYRYCDDGLVLGKTKAELWVIRDIIHGQMEMIDLEVKPNERVFPIEEGIDFLGYVIHPDYVGLRKRIKQKFARKMHKVKSRRRRRELIVSFYGMTKHADCNKLFNKLTGKKMKSFKELNVVYRPEDGEVYFPGPRVSVRDLVNVPITVYDCTFTAKTQYGAKRCVVAVIVNGEKQKFITDSKEMKNILQQIKEIEDGFPFETTIKSESFDKGKFKYIFT